MHDATSLLATLQSHASLRADALAHVLPERVITYRRLWSRIERASARLQGPWQVHPWQRVAYIGHGHPDAIVLYCALLRIGACLLPLEGLPVPQAQQIAQQAGATLAIHDDAIVLSEMPAQPLSLLLDDWCHFYPVLMPEDPDFAGLVLPVMQNGVRVLQPGSLRQLSQLAVPARDGSVAQVGATIFTLDTLSRIIFPALLTARPLQFAAVGSVRRFG